MKIDYVVTYVDPNDAAWRSQFDEHIRKTTLPKTEQSRRYSANNLFKFVFRGIDKYMPWINNVFLVVSSKTQVPEWIDQGKVKVVTHDQFIPREFLPTFNSCVIECFLHKIPELGPFFIYGNDDTYITDSCLESDFYEDMMPLVRVSPHYFTPLQYFANAYAKLCHNMTTLVATANKMSFASNMFFTPSHYQTAYSKSIYSTTFEKYKPAILHQAKHKFRAPTSISHYLFAQDYALTTGNKYQLKISGDYFSMDEKSITQIIQTLALPKRPALICINDNNDLEQMLVKPFTEIFKDKSQYEL